jgi:Ca2+-binding RTX toxin-like protein
VSLHKPHADKQGFYNDYARLAGLNTITGGAGADVLTGGGGADIFNVDVGRDEITDFGVGYDLVTITAGATLAATVTATYTVVAAGAIDNKAAVVDAVFTVANAIDFDASAAKDTTNGITISATGNANASILVGTDQDDVIIGGLGADEIWGDAGNDTLTGGAGADLLTGGLGTDTFIFTSYATTDSVTDFVAGASGELTAYGLTSLNAELAAATVSTRVTTGNGGSVVDSDAANFSAVISAAADITFAADDNIFLVDATTVAGVQTALAGNIFFASSSGSIDGDGLLVAWIDEANDLNIGMARVDVTTVGVVTTLTTAVVSTIATFTGTYTLAGLTTSNFDFIA